MYSDCHCRSLTGNSFVMSCNDFVEIIENSWGLEFIDPQNPAKGLQYKLRDNSGLTMVDGLLAVDYAAICAAVANCP